MRYSSIQYDFHPFRKEQQKDLFFLNVSFKLGAFVLVLKSWKMEHLSLSRVTSCFQDVYTKKPMKFSYKMYLPHSYSSFPQLMVAIQGIPCQYKLLMEMEQKA
jgi:hypothetical protein